MLFWLFRRLFLRGFESPREPMRLGDLDALARSGAAGWLLAQERARLDFLAAREAYAARPSGRALSDLLERLVRLESTNALVQALLNERRLEEVLSDSGQDAEFPERTNPGKSR